MDAKTDEKGRKQETFMHCHDRIMAAIEPGDAMPPEVVGSDYFRDLMNAFVSNTKPEGVDRAWFKGFEELPPERGKDGRLYRRNGRSNRLVFVFTYNRPDEAEAEA